MGEGDPDTEGWDELPACCFARLTRLRRLTLGTAVPYLLGGAGEAWLPAGMGGWCRSGMLECVLAGLT